MTQGAWKKNWPLVLLVTALALGSPFLNLVPQLSGWPGVGVGEVLNIVAGVLGFYAITRMLTVTRS